MRKIDQESRLIPLRKFAVPGIYEMPYLSLLVQRKKLKAKRIGRNYFTCEKWFYEYLELHAQDKKRDEYFRCQEKKNKKQSINKFFKFNINRVRAAALTVAVFLLFSIIGFGLYISYDQGRIAGVEESISPSYPSVTP